MPATTEMLFAMGAGDRLAGVSSYDRFPPEVERLPRVGGLLDPDVERVLSLKPDLVIVYDTQTDLKQQLERAQIPIFGYVHRDLRDITATMRALGERIGAKAAADAAASAHRAAARRHPAGASRAGRGRRRCSSSGASRARCATSTRAAATDSCTTCSSSPAAPTCSPICKKQSVDMSTEMVLTRAPEVILELHYGDSLKPEQLGRERLVWNALASVPAVRTNRVYLLGGDEFVVPGPRIVMRRASGSPERCTRTFTMTRTYPSGSSV